MITTNYELLSPRNRAIKEIKYMLYNYYKIDELIDKRKEELIDNMNLSTAAWLRGINQDSNTFEDVIAGFDDDWKIRRYRHWQDFLRNLFAILEKFESSKYFVFLQLTVNQPVTKRPLPAPLQGHGYKLEIGQTGDGGYVQRGAYTGLVLEPAGHGNHSRVVRSELEFR